MLEALHLRIVDPDRTILHRAVRVALVTPTLFAVGLLLLRDPQFALIACFGSFAALAMADFTGPRGSRLRAYLALGLLGVVLVAAGTLLSQTLWPAVLGMLAVGVVFQFLMVMGGQFALGNNAVILAFVIAVMVPVDPSALPSRIAGWIVALLVSALAATFLWPRHERRDLHDAVAATCRALAATASAVAAGEGVAAARATCDAAIARLRDVQQVLGFRMVGAPEQQRALLGLIDSLVQGTRFAHALPEAGARAADAALARAMAQTLGAIAAAAEACALGTPLPVVPLEALVAARHAHRELVDDAARAALAAGAPAHDVVAGFHDAFRFRVLSYMVLTMAVDAGVMGGRVIDLHDDFAVLEPQQPPSVVERWRAALLPQLSLRAVWLRNSVRAGVALALAVLVAKVSDIGHAFWVVLATLSVLRSNVTTTGASIVSALGGAVAGFTLATLGMLVVGQHALALWIALPFLVFLAGYAPAAVSFAAGQAMFALLVVGLFNLMVPEGWEVGVVRVEAVALGGVVALAASLIMWPRGAAAALREELALHLRAADAFLADALGTLAGRPAASLADARAATIAARQRADEAMTAFMGERGEKRVPLAVWVGVSRIPIVLRLAADAAMGLARAGYTGINDGPAAERFATALGAVRASYDDVAMRLADPDAASDPAIAVAIDDLARPPGSGHRVAIFDAIAAWLDAHRNDPAALPRVMALTWGTGWLGYLAHLRVANEPAIAQVTSHGQAT